MSVWRLQCCLVVLCLFSFAIQASETSAPPLAPGYGKLGYPLPPVGSYELPALGFAANGDVLDQSGTQRKLHDLFGKQFVLLAFIYSSCSDINGCPLTSHVFYQIKAKMKHDPELAAGLKLISLSFDPAVDTPEVMSLYGNNFSYAGNSGVWSFITTESGTSLKPILNKYNQEIVQQVDSDGTSTVGYSHVLRVFLIDPEKNIRNIYSADFLHQDLVLNDVKTLFQKTNSTATVALQKPSEKPVQLSMPGDDKRGYEKASYETRSLALEHRTGEAADLIRFIRQPPLGLPAVPIPKNNPISERKIELGRKLFFDRRLSLNDTFSCAMCHIPEQGFASNELAMAVGIEGRSVRRNSPTIYNSAYAQLLFHDGREDSLEQQAWGPLLSHNEMANPSIGYVLNKIRRIVGYQEQFDRVFGAQGLSMETVGKALASYQRTLVSADSPFDRWHYGRDESALSQAEKRGFNLFVGKAGCVACHSVGEQSAIFMDNQLHNTGLGYRESMGIPPENRLMVIAPGVTINISRAVIEQVGAKPPADVGRYEITQNPYDRWKYKTPSLRNVALTAPYMHNGSLSTLSDVVDFYDAGGVVNELLDPLIKPLNLNAREKQDLVAFMQALTGSNVNTLVADAFAAPVGDIRKGDPNWVHGTDVEVR